MFTVPEKYLTGPEKLLADAVRSLRRRVDEFDARMSRTRVPRPSGDARPEVVPREEKVSPGSRKTAASSVHPADLFRDARFMMLREMVSVLFRQQGSIASVNAGGGRTGNGNRLSPEKAAELVADDGYWGVDRTSERIVDFALSAAGDDPGIFDRVREGVAKGFLQAKKAFPGILPAISLRTFDAVMNKLDAWAADHPA